MVGCRLMFSVAGGATFHQREPTHAGGGLTARHRAPLLHPQHLIGTISHLPPVKWKMAVKIIFYKDNG